MKRSFFYVLMCTLCFGLLNCFEPKRIIDVQGGSFDPAHVSMEGLDNQHATLTTLSNKEVFCSYWDSAKICLLALKDSIKNPIVKMVIGLVIGAGDGLKSSLCG